MYPNDHPTSFHWQALDDLPCNPARNPPLPAPPDPLRRDLLKGGIGVALLGFDVLPPNIYQLQELPHAIEAGQLALISAIAMVLSIGATLLPSWQASRLDPAEALRYE